MCCVVVLFFALPRFDLLFLRLSTNQPVCRTCPLLFCGDDFSKDQLHAITYAEQQGAILDPIIAKADFSRIGIFGHSMGGAATLMSSANATANGIKVHAHQYAPTSSSLSSTTSQSSSSHITSYFFSGTVGATASTTSCRYI